MATLSTYFPPRTQGIPVIGGGNFSVTIPPLTTGQVVGTMNATNSPTSWAITGGNNLGYFAISNSGVLTVTSAGASGITVGQYNLTVQASNMTGNGTITFSVFINSAPVVTNAFFTNAMPMNVGEVIGTMTATNSPTAWAITAGNASGYYAINNSGVVSVTSAGSAGIIVGSYSLTVKASNSFGSNSGTCSITITGIPVVTNGNFAISMPLTTGQVVGTMTATNSPTTWLITAGNSSGFYAISNSGVVTVTSAGASGITATSYSLTVQATNSSGSGSGTCAVTVSSSSSLWNLVLDQNGIASTRPINQFGNPAPTNGIYPYGLPESYSWYFGGESWLGDLSRLPANGKLPTCSAMTAWHIIYCEAVSAGGAAKPSVPCNVIMRNYKSWVHLISGGWIAQQAAPPDFVVNGRFDGAQSGNNATGVTTTANPDGTFTAQAPPNDAGDGTGWANHGWINSRGGFTAGTVDGAFSWFEICVDQPNANKLCASGIDWWQTTSANYPDNTGYSQTEWIRLTTDFQIVTGCSLDPSILQADPPPPLVGLI